MSKEKSTAKKAMDKAKKMRYYPYIKKLIDQYGVKVKQWIPYNHGTGQVFHADTDNNTVVLPIPVCSESAYICLHEIGHIVEGDRVYVYLMEYHAEQFAIKHGKLLKLPQLQTHHKHAREYVLSNLVEDVLFRNLNPLSVRKDVRRWLGLKPQLLMKKSRRMASKIINNSANCRLADHSKVTQSNINHIIKNYGKKH